MAKAKLGENIQFEIKDGKLFMEVDLTEKGTISSSGKSMVIATTRGNIALPGSEVKIGVNIYLPKQK